MMFLRVLGFITIALSIYFVCRAVARHPGSAIVYLRYGGPFLLGVSLVLFSFHRLRWSAAVCIGGFLCLASADVVAWQQGLQPLSRVLIPWGAGGVVGLIAFFECRGRKGPDAP